jgi:hypothetical protein
MIYEFEAAGGNRISWEQQISGREAAPEPLRPSQSLDDLTWLRIRVVAVGSQRLTAWTMARPTLPEFGP